VLLPVVRAQDVTARADLGADEKKIFPLVDGVKCVGEIVEQARLGEFEAFSALFQLLTSGAVRLAPEVRSAAS
jgi:hypothetical protein